jgi:hypothetical protein
MTRAAVNKWAATVGVVTLLFAQTVAQAMTTAYPQPGSLHYAIMRDDD